MNIFFKNINEHFINKKPFVLYNKPNSNTIVSFLQNNDDLIYDNKLNESGFVFAPFDTENYIFFNENNCEVSKIEGVSFNENFSEYSDLFPDNEVRFFHEKLVQNGIDAILDKQFLKVVLSRKESVAANQDLFLTYFKKLVQTYKTAFCYCFYHPKVGMWLGATPEQLLKTNANKLTTVALAGTQLKKNEEEVFWGEKEKEEQLFVTQFIELGLNPFVTNLHKTDPYTFQAGNLLHIKTDIQATKKEGVNWSEVIKALHPTPALCGLPKAESKKFIINNEGYDRKYYSGFLGEINNDFVLEIENKSDLFVNLRCMELEKNTAQIFIGGGITKDSVPTDEFIETINKSQTIKKILG